MTFTAISDNDNIIDCNKWHFNRCLKPCLFDGNKWHFNRFLNAVLSRLPPCSQRSISCKYQAPNCKTNLLTHSSPATSVWGLKLLVYEALSYWCMRPYARNTIYIHTLHTYSSHTAASGRGDLWARRKCSPATPQPHDTCIYRYIYIYIYIYMCVCVFVYVCICM